MTTSVIPDRRRSPRVLHTFDAVLVDGRRRCVCRTRDFCTGGVLLEHDSLNDWPPQTRLRLEIMPAPGRNESLTFEIEVRHHRLPFLGAAFINPSPTLVQALYRYARVSAPSDDFHGQPWRPRLVVRLAHSAGDMPEVYESLLVDALRQARDELAQAIGDGRVLARGVDGQHLHGVLAKYAREIARHASARFAQDLRRLAGLASVTAMAGPREGTAGHGSAEIARLRPSGAGRPSLERLALIDRHEFEDWLVVNIATRSIEAELGQTLVRFKAGLETELGEHTSFDNHPVAPASLMQGLHGVLKPLQLSQGELALLYRLLGPALARFLHDWYEALMDGLDYAELWRKPRSAPPGAQNSAAATEANAATGGGSHGAEPARPSMGGNTLHTLRALVELQSELKGSSKGDEAGAQTGKGERQYYSRQELESILDRLALPDPDGTSGGGAKDSVSGHERPSLKQGILSSLQGLEGDRERLLPEAESELIDFSERLLRAIMEDPLVSSAFKEGLERTRYWVLRSILADDRFFAHERHPLRLLLNRLGQLSAGRLAPERFRVFLDGLLEQGRRPECAPDLFELLLAEVEERLARQEHQIQRHAERLAKAAEGRRLLTEARQRVHEDLQERLLDRPIPHLILELLYDLEWRQHLLICLLKQEASYYQALAVLDELLNFPLNGGPVRDPRRWADSYRILSLVRAELPRLGADSRRARWLDAVTAWLREGQSPGSLVLPLERFQALEACYMGDGLEEMADLGKAAPGQAGAQVFSTALTERERGRLSALKVGDWLLLRENPGDERYLRLAWIDRNRYGFVHLEGQSVQELVLSGAQLVRMLDAKQAWRLGDREQRPVDQAMIRVVQSVYQDMLSSVRLDPLTGLVNRHEFERQLEHHLTRGQGGAAEPRHLLIHLDIDRFRVINHGLGTAAGDGVLRELARLLVGRVGVNGVVGRLGSNEFGVLLTWCGKREGLEFAERLRADVERQEFHYQSHPIRITLSLGVALESAQPDSAGELLKRAGLACMAAKEQGGNRVRLYQPGSHDQARQQQMLDWVARLEQPLGQVVALRCQAIVPIGRLDAEPHYEILLGIRGPDGGLLSPVPLIEAAEKFNRMQRIDRWVTESVFGWLRWRQNMHQGQALPDFSINLSGNSLNDEGFREALLELLGSNASLTSKICFEITETAAIANLDQVVEFVTELKRHGCRLALDDFGTGLSSYAYLQRLPVDYVKIDGIFIRNLVESPRDRALVKSIAELARFMGIRTIAEYVENERILELLGEFGVDYAQGYQVGKPVPLETI